MKNNPLVSIIIPTYNREELVKSTIISVTNQTYENLEIIVVDDGSTDETESVVTNICDDRIVYIKHEQNKGANAARNTGLEYSSGKYISYLDSDVVMLENKIAKQVNEFIKSPNNVGVIYSPTYAEYNGFLKTTGLGGKSGDIYSDLLSLDVKVITSTMLLRRECFDRCGSWDEALPSFNEYDLCLQIAKDYHFRYIPCPLTISKHHDQGNITNNIKKRNDGMEGIITKWGDEMKLAHGPGAVREFRSRSEMVTYRAVALKQARDGNRIESLRCAKECLKRHEYMDSKAKFLINYSTALLGRQLHDLINENWYRLTGDKTQDQLNSSVVNQVVDTESCS